MMGESDVNEENFFLFSPREQQTSERCKFKMIYFVTLVKCFYMTESFDFEARLAGVLGSKFESPIETKLIETSWTLIDTRILLRREGDDDEGGGEVSWLSLIEFLSSCALS